MNYNFKMDKDHPLCQVLVENTKDKRLKIYPIFGWRFAQVPEKDLELPCHHPEDYADVKYYSVDRDSITYE